MKKSELRMLEELEAFANLINNPNVSNEQLDSVFDAFLSRNVRTIRKVRVPKKKVRRGIGSY